MSNFKFLLSDPSFAPFAEIAIAAECTLSVTCGDTSPKGRGKGGCKFEHGTWLSLWESWHGEAVTERALGSPSGRAGMAES